METPVHGTSGLHLAAQTECREPGSEEGGSVRIRQVKPEFFGDADIAALPFRARLTYIGLWLICDDAGWLPVDYVQIGHDLYGFDSRVRREAWVIDDLVTLQAAGRLIAHPCGHGEIPTMPKHQRMTSGVRRVEMHRKDHLLRCLTVSVGDIPPNSADIAGLPTGNGKEMERYGTERNGKVARARDGSQATTDEEPGPLKAALGPFEAIVGGRP